MARTAHFSLSEADAVEAARVATRYRFTRWPTAAGICAAYLVIVAMLYSIHGAMFGQPILIAAVAAPVLMFAGLYSFVIPRQARRQFGQSKTLHGETQMRWDEAGIDLRGTKAGVRLEWADLHATANGSCVLVLFQTERAYSIIPLSGLSVEQREDLLACAATAP